MKYSEFKQAEAEVFRRTIWPSLFPLPTNLAHINEVQLTTDFVYGDSVLSASLSRKDLMFYGIKHKEVPFSQRQIDNVRKSYEERTGLTLKSFYGTTLVTPAAAFDERVRKTTGKKLMHFFLQKAEGKIPSCSEGKCETSFRRAQTYSTMKSDWCSVAYENPFVEHTLLVEIGRSYNSDAIPKARISFSLKGNKIHNVDTDWSIFNMLKDDLRIPVQTYDNEVTVDIVPKNGNRGRLTICTTPTSIYGPASPNANFEVSEKIQELERLTQEIEKYFCDL